MPYSIVEQASVYLPAEWRHSLAHNKQLSEHTSGAALFADISGFTTLTEALSRALGLRHGAEVLTIHLNNIYDALITEVDRYGGSVVNFAGDAITCWFEEEDDRKIDPSFIPRHAPLRAAACAFEMQRVLREFPAVDVPGLEVVKVAMKISLASGATRRFVVGDPEVQIMSTLTGKVLERMAAGAKLANPGDVIIDEITAKALGNSLVIQQAYGVGPWLIAQELLDPAPPSPWPVTTESVLREEAIKPWLLPPVYARLKEGLGEFLTELRPAVALFLRFQGIDYETDENAGSKLDAFVRWVQRVTAHQEGMLLQVSIGDKGSYLLGAWGAPLAHEDDSRRAVSAALELRSPPSDLSFIHSIQIGISQGIMRTGAYGGVTRRTYSILGDQVNLAARLMELAHAGEVIASRSVQKAAGEDLEWIQLPDIQVKGKNEPVKIDRLLGVRQISMEGANLHRMAGKMVGRGNEMAQLLAFFDRARSGSGQIIRLVGPSGVGKSCLASEFGLAAARLGARVSFSICLSTSQQISYAPWRPVFMSLLFLDKDFSQQRDPLKLITQAVYKFEPELEEHQSWQKLLPLLGDLLGIAIPDNPTTSALDPRLRQEALLTLSVELVKASMSRQPLMIILDDIQWMDEASKQLAIALGRALSKMRVVLLFIQRLSAPGDEIILPELNTLTSFHQLEIGGLQPQDIASLIEERLNGTLHPLAHELIQAQAQGNPYYAEQLVDTLTESGMLLPVSTSESDKLPEDLIGYKGWVLAEQVTESLRQAGCLVKDPQNGMWKLAPAARLADASLNIPESMRAAVLARLDRLPESSKLTLKVASVIGRIFELAVLARTHPSYPGRDILLQQMDTFIRRDFIQVEAPQPYLTYLYKHAMTHEVIYETLPLEQQQNFHRAMGEMLEERRPDEIEQIAYHYSRGGIVARTKALSYLDKAARKAQHENANETALNLFRQALSIEENWLRQSGLIEILHVLGRRKEEHEALNKLETLPGAPKYETAYHWGLYYEATGDYTNARRSVETALEIAREQFEQTREANCLSQLGLIARRQGDYEAAKNYYQFALDLFPGGETGPNEAISALAQALTGMGIVNRQQGDFDQANAFFERALKLSQKTGDLNAEADALNSLAGVAFYQRNIQAALNHNRRVLEIRRSIGDRRGEGICLYNLALILFQSGDYSHAQQCFIKALDIQKAVGNRWEQINILTGLSVIDQEVGRYAEARVHFEEGLVLCREIGDASGEVYILANLGATLLEDGCLKEAEEVLSRGKILTEEQNDKYQLPFYLSHLARVNLHSGCLEASIECAKAALELRDELKLASGTATDLATMSLAYLFLPDRMKALDCSRDALKILGENPEEVSDYPQRDYLAISRVFEYLGEDAFAMQAQEAGRQLVLDRANKIIDPGLRQSFLEKVGVNRALSTVDKS